MSMLSSPPGTAAIPGWLTLGVIATITAGCGIAELALDLTGRAPDPVIADTFRLAMGSLLVLVGATHQKILQGATRNETSTLPAARSGAAPADAP
jgi:hypothetical protein